MAYTVEMIDTQTGETRLLRQDLPWYHNRDGGSSLFWWTEGNLGCDCNRGLEFYRAEQGNDTEIECNGNKPNRFRVTKAILDDGEIVPIDG